MKLDEAIEHAKNTIERMKHDGTCDSCKHEHEQLLAWLEELKNYRTHEHIDCEKDKALPDEELQSGAYVSKNITNADRIRAMSDEELAEWMSRCNAYGESAEAGQWLSWLREPTKGEHQWMN